LVVWRAAKGLEVGGKEGEVEGGKGDGREMWAKVGFRWALAVVVGAWGAWGVTGGGRLVGRGA